MTAVTPPPIASLDDVFLTAFYVLDDLYREPVPPAVRERPRHERIEMSDGEGMVSDPSTTLSAVQEALSIDSEASFLRFF